MNQDKEYYGNHLTYWENPNVSNRIYNDESLKN